MSIDTATGTEAPAYLSEQRVRHIFSSLAPDYERFNALSSFGAYRMWLNRMIEKADIEPDDVVLDVASGTGDVCFALAQKKRPARIVCSDLVSEMLEIARTHEATGASHGVPINFEVINAQSIPYPDESFDAVTVAYGIRNMPEREQALSEMYRILRPGGSFTCLEFSTPPHPLWRALYHFYLRFCIPLWGWLITKDRDSFVYLAQSIHAFPDQKAFAHMLTDAGFSDVKWVNCTGGIAVVHTAHKPINPNASTNATKN